jgi:hypothetical protein
MKLAKLIAADAAEYHDQMVGAPDPITVALKRTEWLM